MYKEVLESIQGISLYGIISICLFFIFFTGVLVWSCALKKNYLNTMGHLPLEEGNSAMPLSHAPLEPQSGDGRESFGVRWQAERDTALVGDGQPRTKAVSALRSATALHKITREPLVQEFTARISNTNHSPSPGLSRRSASEGGGEGEPVSTPPAFTPMGNNPQKL